MQLRIKFLATTKQSFQTKKVSRYLGHHDAKDKSKKTNLGLINTNSLEKLVLTLGQLYHLVD